MYIWALYIGLSAAVLTYLIRRVVPAYASAIHLGYEPDEMLWWRAVYQGALPPHSDRLVSILYGLCIGASLIYTTLWLPWQQQMPFLNVFLVSAWVGALLLLARIDKLCWLLPDVLTQSLLWIGLVWLAWQQPHLLAEAVFSVAFVYSIGRVINFFAFFCLKQPLIGMGDVKLLVAVAVWLGISAIIPIFLVASSCCYSVAAVRQLKWRPRGYCAFGPYLVFATFAVWCFRITL